MYGEGGGGGGEVVLLHRQGLSSYCVLPKIRYFNRLTKKHEVYEA